jgi:GR25 family glycosyltransferase involved in LPS biosynthesis
LIFEDDVIIYENGLKNIEKALDDISKIRNWDMLYLSGLVIDNNLKYITDNLVKANIILTGHAYAVNKCAYDRILKYDPELDCAIDGWYGQQAKEGGELGSLFNKYLVYPLSMHQRHSVSDIDISDNGIPSNGHGLAPYIATYSKPIIK